MVLAGNAPLSNKNKKNCAREGKLKDSIHEEARRRKKRKEAGLIGENNWQAYRLLVREKGLMNKESLNKRINLLWSAAKVDSQGLYIAHLAKTLALKGEEVLAAEQMRVWGKHVERGSLEERRWKKTSLCLEQFLVCKKKSDRSMTAKQWNAGRKRQVAKEEVEEQVRSQKQEEPGLYLFDKEDEALLQVTCSVPCTVPCSWTPKSQDSFGMWD